jgi:ribosome-associated protein
VQNQLNFGEVRSAVGRTRARARRKILTGIDMDTDYKSRTRKKNEDRALQRLGEQLVALPFGQLETMELPDELLAAIELARKIRSHGARRRQIQYIRALMRHIDRQPIETALERIRSGNLRK